MNKTLIIGKKENYDIEGKSLLSEFKNFLGIKSLQEVNVLNLYNIQNIETKDYEIVKENLFINDNTDIIYENIDDLENTEFAFRVQAKDGQYNQKEDMVNEYFKKIYNLKKSFVKHSKIIILNGVNKGEFEKIKEYYINFVDSKELKLDDESVFVFEDCNEDIEIVDGFINMNEEELKNLITKFAMDLGDIKFVQEYFKKQNRNPNIWELKTIDTYWSDHCRHTTFLTEINNIDFKDGKYKELLEDTFKEYLHSRKFAHNNEKPITLMDLGTINAKELRKKGLLDDMEVSEEINACSVEVKVDVDGTDEDWLLLFKNETHNHPTEIEPYGGAHTCIGGGIRDPLSSRAFVHQAMRITGAKDPRTPYENTLKGKLPQRKICKTAMEGYSDYGNQIGVTGGYVKEFYHDGFEAKRMELGALVAGAPKENVVREQPITGDKIVLLGARTGRDGLGAAVGSSNVQSKSSLENAGAEVQKGNPLAERNIIRLFRDNKATKLIKRCNDFGAGGVAVAIGELADGLIIDLDRVPLKYKGLHGGEIALSESQERMAVVIGEENIDEFLKLAKEENIEANIVAEVTEDPIMKMVWRGQEIINLSREFLNSNGAKKEVDININSPENIDYLTGNKVDENKSIKENIVEKITNINSCSQKGLIENFDNSIGRGTVLAQLGGKNKITNQEGMVAKMPVLNGKTNTCSIMTFGYNPELLENSQFHGGYYAVIESITKAVSLGGDYRKIRLTFQEFFERLDYDADKWSKPVSALLGAYKAMKDMDIPTIGGKDSMSGTYEDIKVPPTLISFAVTKENINNIVSREFKKDNSTIVLVEAPILENGLLNIEILKSKYEEIRKLIEEKTIISTSIVSPDGIGVTVSEMALGNGIGVKLENNINDKLFKYLPGSIIVEVENGKEDSIKSLGEIIGYTNGSDLIEIQDSKINIEELINLYNEPLNEVYTINEEKNNFEKIDTNKNNREFTKNNEKARVLIPVFPGTTGEYDFEKSFIEAGGEVKKIIINTLTNEDYKKSLEKLKEEIENNNILVLANGALMGEELESNGKLFETILNEEEIKTAVEDLINKRNGLIIGTGAGFIGLVDSGLIEFGEVRKGTSIEISKNDKNGFISDMEDIKVISNNSPWLKNMNLGDVYSAPVATKQGKLNLGAAKDKLIENNQVITVFNNSNITNSEMGIEGLISPCGRVIGLTTLIERMEEGLFKNLEIKGLSKIIESGVSHFN